MDPSTLFMVRVWRQPLRGRSVFRASVRAVDAEHERLFTRPADLAHYLAHYLSQHLAQASASRAAPSTAPDESQPRSDHEA